MAALLGMIAGPGQPKSTPAVIAMATIAAATQSTVRQNGGHQRVLFTKPVRCCLMA
jgi:hypothetical protein